MFSKVVNAPNWNFNLNLLMVTLVQVYISSLIYRKQVICRCNSLIWTWTWFAKSPKSHIKLLLNNAHRIIFNGADVLTTELEYSTVLSVIMKYSQYSPPHGMNFMSIGILNMKWQQTICNTCCLLVESKTNWSCIISSLS